MGKRAQKASRRIAKWKRYEHKKIRTRLREYARSEDKIIAGYVASHHRGYPLSISTHDMTKQGSKRRVDVERRYDRDCKFGTSS